MELVIDFENLDKTIIRQLQKEAEQHEMTLNNFVLYLVRLGLATLREQSESTVYHDLDDLAGTWSAEEAESFAMNTTDFAKIDDKLWP